MNVPTCACLSLFSLQLTKVQRNHNYDKTVKIISSVYSIIDIKVKHKYWNYQQQNQNFLALTIQQREGYQRRFYLGSSCLLNDDVK